MLHRIFRFFKRHANLWLICFFAFWAWYVYCIPKKLFGEAYSTVLYDRHGKLLGARVSADGQWRFPPSHKIPPKFETCLLEFEDRSFYEHYGVSARGIARAVKQDITNKRLVSGGSTLTMQLARMMGKHRERSLLNKCTEMLMATRLEMQYSKREILNLYVSNAPFGNNVVGLDAAAWRYFGRPADKLSWAECATLAVLPNAPGLIYPGKNHQLLLAKRNRLLKRLFEQKKIDSISYQLAVMETVPGRPLALPNAAPHLLQSLVIQQGGGKAFHSCIDNHLQEQVSRLAAQHAERLSNNYIHNGAIIVTSTATGEVLAYLGNMPGLDKENNCDVDCALAMRSSGSTLKPLLFESAMESGIITPRSLLFDVPARFSGFSPKNFNKTYDGAVQADKALAKSLNIPFVLLLNQYGQPRFCSRLKECGLSTVKESPTHYGLSLILGGAEITLYDITGVYRNMGAMSMNGVPTGLHFTDNDKHVSHFPQWDLACTYKTLECMTELNRPDEEGNWKLFSSARKIAWKTGTSFGFRDAWAIGVTPDYTVGVWIGNADGEGRPGLTGIKAAAPLMFDIFSVLPMQREWFTPNVRFKRVALCRESGCLASPNCPHVRMDDVPESCLSSKVCEYHRILTLSPDGKHLANSDCFPIKRLKSDTFFVLPPLVAKYYRQRTFLKAIPSELPGCGGATSNGLSLIYPKPHNRVLLSGSKDTSQGDLVLEAAHRNPTATIYWHLDDVYLGSTHTIHQMLCSPTPGKHRLTLADDKGQEASVEFEVVR